MMGSQIVLNFHGIGEPHAGVDDAERPYWVSESQFRTLVERIMERSDRTRFLWTFDDGNASDLLAAEILSQHEATGRFFLLTGRFDDVRYLSRADAKALAQSGMIVGLHGRDHVDWRRVGPQQLASETIDARAELAEATGQAVDEVAIPFGAYNRSVVAHLKRQGFACIHTSDGGEIRQGQRIWNRTSIRGDMTEEQLDAIINGHAPPVQRARRLASRLLRRYVV